MCDYEGDDWVELSKIVFHILLASDKLDDLKISIIPLLY